jgi:hypothetical protein
MRGPGWAGVGQARQGDGGGGGGGHSRRSEYAGVRYALHLDGKRLLSMAPVDICLSRPIDLQQILQAKLDCAHTRLWLWLGLTCALLETASVSNAWPSARSAVRVLDAGDAMRVGERCDANMSGTAGLRIRLTRLERLDRLRHCVAVCRRSAYRAHVSCLAQGSND